MERFWAKDGTWWLAVVTDDRRTAPEKNRRRRREVRVHFVGEKTSRNDAWLGENSDELRAPVIYLDTFITTEGFIEDDQWEVERILDVTKKKALVRWAPPWGLGT